MSEIKWMIVDGAGGKQIGALGFIGNKVAVIASFYDDLDGNKDGKVGVGEWIVGKLSPIGVKNIGVTEVAMAARYDMRVLEKDPDFHRVAMQMYLEFAAGLVADGLYAVYFSNGVSSLVKPIAGRITSNLVAQFVIRKGMEDTVKKIYDRTVKP